MFPAACPRRECGQAAPCGGLPCHALDASPCGTVSAPSLYVGLQTGNKADTKGLHRVRWEGHVTTTGAMSDRHAAATQVSPDHLDVILQRHLSELAESATPFSGSSRRAASTTCAPFQRTGAQRLSRTRWMHPVITITRPLSFWSGIRIPSGWLRGVRSLPEHRVDCGPDVIFLRSLTEMQVITPDSQDRGTGQRETTFPAHALT